MHWEWHLAPRCFASVPIGVQLDSQELGDQSSNCVLEPLKLGQAWAHGYTPPSHHQTYPGRNFENPNMEVSVLLGIQLTSKNQKFMWRSADLQGIHWCSCAWMRKITWAAIKISIVRWKDWLTINMILETFLIIGPKRSLFLVHCVFKASLLWIFFRIWSKVYWSFLKGEHNFY